MKIKIVDKINQVKNKKNIFQYKIFNRFKKTSGLNKLKNRKLIVSLTTYPARFDVVYLTIESLFDQTLKPDKIILWLSKEELIENVIPQKILNLKKRGLTIRLVDENLKSYKKLIYAIKEFAEYTIITCDDDTLYPKEFVEKLYYKYINYPKCIIAYRCSDMKKMSINKLAPYLEWKSAKVNKPSFSLFPTGVGGILYPSCSLNNEVFNKEIFLKLAPLGDDIWFKAMALLNNTKTIMVYDESIDFPLIKNSQDNALWHINVAENKNDEQLKNVFDHFELYKYIK